MYDEIYNWAYAVGRTILEQSDKGDDLLRGEDLPGRFLEKLSSRLTEYKTNRNIGIDLSMQRRLFEKKWYGDSFRYMKSAVLSGLLNSLGARTQRKEEASS
ncbi:MAG: hypothetical protein QXR65_08625 [Candidatus Bathyarchaeia archaeon]